MVKTLGSEEFSLISKIISFLQYTCNQKAPPHLTYISAPLNSDYHYQCCIHCIKYYTQTRPPSLEDA